MSTDIDGRCCSGRARGSKGEGPKHLLSPTFTYIPRHSTYIAPTSDLHAAPPRAAPAPKRRVLMRFDEIRWKPVISHHSSSFLIIFGRSGSSFLVIRVGPRKLLEDRSRDRALRIISVARPELGEGDASPPTSPKEGRHAAATHHLLPPTQSLGTAQRRKSPRNIFL